MTIVVEGKGKLRVRVGVRGGIQNSGGHDMKICPVAIAVGCKKCPVFSVCPAKSVIGDFKAE